MNGIAIKTNNLTKQYGSRIAVDKLNIELREGEIYSLLGTNGAGKTTTIKMLCCLAKPTDGSASVLGYNLTHDAFKIKELIGVSPQETAVAEHLTCYENLMLMGGIFGLKNQESKNRALNLMNLLEIENRPDQARKLSGGLQRRLTIAMALMSNPKILFLDEPTLGLDPHSRKSVWSYIEKLKGEKTILLTTHYLDEADALADHIAIMDKGKIIAQGTAGELKTNYKSIRSLKVFADQIPTTVFTNLQTLFDTIIKTPLGLEIKAKEIDLYPIMAILQANKVVITGIQMQEPTLNEVFLHLTGKEIEK